MESLSYFLVAYMLINLIAFLAMCYVFWDEDKYPEAKEFWFFVNEYPFFTAACMLFSAGPLVIWSVWRWIFKS